MKKNELPTFTVRVVHILLELLSQHFSSYVSVKDKKFLLFKFLISHAAIQCEIHIIFEDKTVYFRTEM